MMKTKFRNLLITIAFLFISIGFSLTTWKMFQFRDRLHNLIDNRRWEQTLSINGMYDNNVIVFFGDSQIELWWMAPSFGTLPIRNNGISGDWASKAVKRFDEDVLAYDPKLLVMLIGTNDLGNGQSVESIIGSIEMMLDKAHHQKIKIILCSLLPVNGEYVANHPLKDILQINDGLKLLSQKYDAEYVDFYSQLSDRDGSFRRKFTSDGLHPNRSGYMKMSQILWPYLLRNTIEISR